MARPPNPFKNVDAGLGSPPADTSPPQAVDQAAPALPPPDDPQAFAQKLREAEAWLRRQIEELGK
jgi:hypothetical protein